MYVTMRIDLFCPVLIERTMSFDDDCIGFIRSQHEVEALDFELPRGRSLPMQHGGSRKSSQERSGNADYSRCRAGMPGGNNNAAYYIIY